MIACARRAHDDSADLAFEIGAHALGATPATNALDRQAHIDTDL
jgi:hypothetical protein